MVTENGPDEFRIVRSEGERVDPLAPRFGQAITATGLLVGILFEMPVLIGAVAIVLLSAVASGWRINLYGIAFRNLVRPLVGAREPEPAVPHRFATLVGASGTTLASGSILLGYPLVGYVIAGGVAIAAGLAAITGFCLGCRMYRQVSYFHRRSLV
ncbi:MAG: DUF4395 domain-containing protein [Halodesulfurarchaeum sp.]